MDSKDLSGGSPIVKNIDPHIFSQIRLTGNLWAGAAGSGYHYEEINMQTIKLKDTVTGEYVYADLVQGRPFNKTISLEGLENPVDLYAWFKITLGQNAVGQTTVDNIYCKIR